MDQAVQLAVYLCLVVFLVAVVVRFVRIQRMPRQIRWEIYPVPHEGERSKHGGSRLEEIDHWEKPPRKDRVSELRFMIPEMVLLKGLWDHNRRLWYRSFPFHFGLYLLVGALAVLVLGVLARLLGFDLTAVTSPMAWLLFVFGTALGIVGALALLWARIQDEDLIPYTKFSHYFNLAAFIVVLGLLAAVFVRAGFDVEIFDSWITGLVTLDTSAFAGGALGLWTMILTGLLVAYVPLTHMSHFFVKWFTWHQIRWDDEPNVRGGRIEKMIEKALNAPVSWAAPHVGADGKKTWADVATEEVNDQ